MSVSLRAVPVVILCVSLFASAAQADEAAQIIVDGPTVVAFFEPVTEAELEEDPDANDALDDFQFYARETRIALDGSGVAFHEVYAREISVIVDGVDKVLRPEVTVGYYFIAPDRTARVEYGVHTDVDVLALVDEVFGPSARKRIQKD